jgi:YVTN family beta-propeller protein
MSAADPGPRIFIAYRRDDSQGFARSIHDRLALRFGPDAVFRDINDIEPGRPWEEAIDAALGSCDVFVLLIGRGWLDATDEDGNRRIDDPEDRHRREIETAIRRRVRMFVALMEDADMPRKKQLPQTPVGRESEGLQIVPALHALRIADHAFDYGIDELVKSIERAATRAGVADGDREREDAAKPRREEERRREEGEEERKREDEERQREEERKRRLRMLAAVGLGAVAVAVAAFLIVSSGGDDEAAAVDGAPIEVGDFPVDLAFGEGGLWVANRLGGSVSFIDGEPPEVVSTGQLGGAPEGVAVGGGSVFVADGGGDTVSELGPDGEPVGEISVALNPAEIAVNGKGVWVANTGSDTVSRINEASIQSIPVGDEPYGLASGAGAVWVTNRADGTVSRIDLSESSAGDPIPVGAEPKGIAVGDDAVWVANTTDGTVSRIDLQSLTAGDPIGVGTEPRGVVSAFGSVWVANGGSNSVSQIDPEQEEVVQTIDVGVGPEGITAGPVSVWVANGGDDTVTRIKP